MLQVAALITGAPLHRLHLAELLLGQGIEVFVLDDLSPVGANVGTCASPDFHSCRLGAEVVVVNERVHRCDVMYHSARRRAADRQQPVHTSSRNQGHENV